MQTSNIMSGAYTDRIIQNNNNCCSSNMDDKSIINESIFINMKDSANLLQKDSKYNKIKVNTLKKSKKLQKLSILNPDISNKTNLYWKILKNQKNSCLLSNHNNNNEINRNVDKNENNKYNILGGGIEKNMKNNSQILIFTKNKPNKLSELNNIKDKIHKYNLTNDFSKSNISESSYTERNNYNSSINENLNIEKYSKGKKN